MSKRALVCDTTLPLYLGRVGRARLLPALFATVYIPESVSSELDMGRLIRPDTIDPRQLSWASIISLSDGDVDALPPNRLGPGERAVIAYARCHPDCWVGLDDRQARELAEDLDLDLIPAVRPLLNELQAEGFRLGSDLYRETLQLAGELEAFDKNLLSD